MDKEKMNEVEGSMNIEEDIETTDEKVNIEVIARQLEKYLNLLHDKVWMKVMGYISHPNDFIWLEDEELKRLSATAWVYRQMLDKESDGYEIKVGDEKVKVLIG